MWASYMDFGGAEVECWMGIRCLDLDIELPDDMKRKLADYLNTPGANGMPGLVGDVKSEECVGRSAVRRGGCMNDGMCRLKDSRSEHVCYKAASEQSPQWEDWRANAYQRRSLRHFTASWTLEYLRPHLHFLLYLSTFALLLSLSLETVTPPDDELFRATSKNRETARYGPI